MSKVFENELIVYLALLASPCYESLSSLAYLSGGILNAHVKTIPCWSSKDDDHHHLYRQVKERKDSTGFVIACTLRSSGKLKF